MEAGSAREKCINLGARLVADVLHNLFRNWEMDDGFPPGVSGREGDRLSLENARPMALQSSMKTESRRPRTFRHWPASVSVPPVDLAAANFFTVDGRPQHPVMEACGNRLVTFESWPPTAPVSPTLLATAGFFYLGQRDEVWCFYCDGKLNNWEGGDDPWIEHARWFPRCAFLLQSKGSDFINSIQESNRISLEERFQWPTENNLESPLESGPVTDPWRVRRETEIEHPPEPGTGTSTEERLRQLQEERRCKVCLDHDVSILLVPCGHLVVCDDCAPNLSRCPICRGFIQDRMKAFLS